MLKDGGRLYNEEIGESFKKIIIRLKLLVSAFFSFSFKSYSCTQKTVTSISLLCNDELSLCFFMFSLRCSVPGGEDPAEVWQGNPDQPTKMIN